MKSLISFLKQKLEQKAEGNRDRQVGQPLYRRRGDSVINYGIFVICRYTVIIL